jgi:glycosyltransferase involved in cell wall biosynthesis
MSKKRVGLVSKWFERGSAYLNLMMYQGLKKAGYAVYVLGQSNVQHKPVGKEWDIRDLTWASGPLYGYPGPWAEKLDLDVLIFVERHDANRLAPLREKFRTYCINMMEYVGPEHVEAYNSGFDGIIAPVPDIAEHFERMGLENVFCVPWGIDLDVFHPLDRPKTGPTKFFHPAGFGGVAGRRGTKEVRAAFRVAETGNSTLLITSQRPGEDVTVGSIRVRHGTMPQPELARLYREADVALLPSKWSGLGLTFLEAMASGLAIITVDAPPFNSFVRDNWNGYLCKTRMRPSPPQIKVDWAAIDHDDFAARIESLARLQALARIQGENSRAWAKEDFDWSRNIQALIALVETGQT